MLLWWIKLNGVETSVRSNLSHFLYELETNVSKKIIINFQTFSLDFDSVASLYIIIS